MRLRYQKRYNKFYVYALESYWDKETKTSKQKSQYLGVADELGGPYKKKAPQNKQQETHEIERGIVDFGDTYAIKATAESSGLYALLQDVFQDKADDIMSLCCYQIIEGESMDNYQNWFDGNIAKVFYKNVSTSSQRTSELLKFLGDNKIHQDFFTKYIKAFFKDKLGILIDSTALPSSINSHLNHLGHTSHGIAENISCLALVDKNSKLPIYFRTTSGDITDSSTLRTTFEEIAQLGLSAEQVILDAGYVSKQNFELLAELNVDFVTRLPRSHKIYYELIDQADLTESIETLVTYGDRTLFIKSFAVTVYENTMYAHIILDPGKKSKDVGKAGKRANILKNYKDENKDSNIEKLNKENRTKEIEKIDKVLKYAGYCVLLSKFEIASDEILPTYYTRQHIEQIFRFSKTNNSLLPLKVHSSQSVDGYLLLHFIALILFIIMRQKLLEKKMVMPASKILLRGLKAKIFDSKIVIQEPRKKAKDIFKALDILVPTVMGV